MYSCLITQQMRNECVMEKAQNLKWKSLHLLLVPPMTVCENWNTLVNLCLSFITYKMGIIILITIIMLISKACEIKWTNSKQNKNGTDMYTLLYLKWITTRTYCRAQGTLLNVMWKPGWEGSLGENGYMYMYGWVALLCTWNSHNIVNRSFSNIK